MKMCPRCHKRALACVDSRWRYDTERTTTIVKRAYICGHCGKYYESQEEISYIKKETKHEVS